MIFSCRLLSVEHRAPTPTLTNTHTESKTAGYKDGLHFAESGDLKSAASVRVRTLIISSLVTGLAKHYPQF